MCFKMILIRGVCVSKWSLSVCASKWSLSGVSKWSGSPQNGWCWQMHYQEASCVRMISSNSRGYQKPSRNFTWTLELMLEMVICPPHFGDVCSFAGRSSDSAGSFVKIAVQRSCWFPVHRLKTTVEVQCGIERLTKKGWIRYDDDISVDHRTEC